YWDELLHQEPDGDSILYDLSLIFKMGLPDAYHSTAIGRHPSCLDRLESLQYMIQKRMIHAA
ncbi:hypothetical protein, partial [Advenella incenata]|uniref:hypothetical protein n=1 Tax=Advenella incenata TaxID=267800 RepID=UPI001A92CE13